MHVYSDCKASKPNLLFLVIHENK